VAQIVSGLRIVLFGCGVEPLDCFRIILRNISAASIKTAQQVLYPANTTYGSCAEPLNGLYIVTRYATSARVSNTQNALRLDIVTTCSFNQLGNLFRGECEDLFVDFEFQNDCFFRRLSLNRLNVVWRQKEKARQQDS